jgi:hypothetical protein
MNVTVPIDATRGPYRSTHRGDPRLVEPHVPVRQTEFDARAARRFLEVLTAPPVGCVELRVLRATFDRQGRVCRGDSSGAGFGGGTLAGWFDDIDRLINEAHKLRDVSGYVTVNPVRSDLLARSDHRLSKSRHTTRDLDVVCLRWLYLDIDALRPADISSTEAELSAAIRRRDAILGDHPALAASGAWGCSGNGAWVLVRLPDYPNDPPHAALLARALATLDNKYSDNTVRIDTATANPARLIGLPGTVKVKGCHRPERPWRPVTLDGIGSEGLAAGSLMSGNRRDQVVEPVRPLIR